MWNLITSMEDIITIKIGRILIKFIMGDITNQAIYFRLRKTTKCIYKEIYLCLLTKMGRK